MFQFVHFLNQSLRQGPSVLYLKILSEKKREFWTQLKKPHPKQIVTAGGFRKFSQQLQEHLNIAMRHNADIGRLFLLKHETDLLPDADRHREGACYSK